MQQGYLKNTVGKEQILEESSLYNAEYSRSPPSFLYFGHFLRSLLESKLRRELLISLTSSLWRKEVQIIPFLFLIGKKV